jgi:outer membrane lipoprotein SlyB
VTLGSSSLGAAIGTAIFPGVGTVIGGFVGLIVGIVASYKISDGVDAIGDLIVDEDAEIDLMLKDQMY